MVPRVVLPYDLKRVIGRLLFLSSFLFLTTCTPSLAPEKEYSAKEVAQLLNESVKGFVALIEAVKDNREIYGYKSISLRRGSKIHSFSIGSSNYSIITRIAIFPSLSIKSESGLYYWTIDGDWLKDSSAARIEVGSDCASPSFSFKGEKLICSYKGEKWEFFKDDSYNFIDFGVDYNDDQNRYCFSLPSDTLFVNCGDNPLDFTSKNFAYYKDVFIDAGIGLHSRSDLHVAKYLSLSYEYMDIDSKVDINIQNRIIGGDDDDLNGRLLYPDGQPRYRVFFVGGGNSRTHGQSYNSESLDRIRSFNSNGGSYVGDCAGAFFASRGYDEYEEYPYYLSISPVVMKHTKLSGSSTGLFIEKDAPILDYSNFGKDYYVANVYHSSGGYAYKFTDKIEVMARFDYPEIAHMHKQPALWSYKKDSESGRVVLIGSHPEIYSSGERRDLMAAMFQYAIDGCGVVKIKGLLKNGIAIVMDKDTEENETDRTKIGDLQCHHFAVFIPSDASNVTVQVEGGKDTDFCIRMAKDSFAFPENSIYESSKEGSTARLSFKSIDAGFWFISVQCLTTVSSYVTRYGQEYTGHINVLNGVPYTIKVQWE